MKNNKNKGGLKIGKLGSGDKSSDNLGKEDGRARADLRPKGGMTKRPSGDFHSGGRT